MKSSEVAHTASILASAESASSIDSLHLYFISQERRSVLFHPFLEFGLRLELRHLDAVDGWAGFLYGSDFVFAHLPNPKDAMPLQAAASEVDRTVVDRPVEVAATD